MIGKELGINLYFKVEGKNPTGSFKYRGSAVDITVAKELGAKVIVLASTGNMAASCAGYA
ncbi:pyridoxal-phosphate dependent enzyme, partial [Francisella tularensis]|uniref:pyridoxal-phosphate dependent enzyme n=1 Tax=Francisella tularensis TaxID=263 RepID=UPI00311AC095